MSGFENETTQRLNRIYDLIIFAIGEEPKHRTEIERKMVICKCRPDETYALNQLLDAMVSENLITFDRKTETYSLTANGRRKLEELNSSGFNPF